METTHEHPVVVRHGVLHYGVGNIPAAVPHTSTYALTNATFPYALAVADLGVRGAVEADPALAAACCARRDGSPTRPWPMPSGPHAVAPLDALLDRRAVSGAGHPVRPTWPGTRRRAAPEGPTPSTWPRPARRTASPGPPSDVTTVTLAAVGQRRHQGHDGVVGGVGPPRGEARLDAAGGRGRRSPRGRGRPSKTTVTSVSGPTEGRELGHEPAPGSGAVAPPPVGARADQVHAVDHPVQENPPPPVGARRSPDDNTGVSEPAASRVDPTGAHLLDAL